MLTRQESKVKIFYVDDVDPKARFDFYDKIDTVCSENRFVFCRKNKEVKKNDGFI